MAQKSIKKTLLSLSVAVALGCSSGNIFAAGDRVEELEARVAELEALVTQLLENQEAIAAVEVAEAVSVEERAETSEHAEAARFVRLLPSLGDASSASAD